MAQQDIIKILDNESLSVLTKAHTAFHLHGSAFYMYLIVTVPAADAMFAKKSISGSADGRGWARDGL